MPTVAARDYRCSWEIPYDFHPRIHAYPGAVSVVRAYIDSSPAPRPSDEAPARRHHKGAETNKMRHYRLGALSATARAVRGTQRLVEERYPLDGAGEAAATTQASPKQHPSRPTTQQPPRNGRPLLNRNRGVQSFALPKKTFTGISMQAVRTTTDVNRSSTPSAERAESPHKAKEEVNEAPCPRAPARSTRISTHTSTSMTKAPPSQARVVSVGKSSPITPALPPSSPPSSLYRRGYRSRTKARYTLPPTYAAQVHQFESQPVPTVTVRDRWTAPPALREIRAAARRVRLATREGFVDELRRCMGEQATAGDVLPRSVLDSYLDVRDAETFNPAAHNFNAVLPDAFASCTDERAAGLYATEQRMWDRIILRVAPLTEARADAHDLGGVCVLDGGHVGDPIFVSTAMADSSGRSHTDREVTDEDDMMAVMVHPFADELPATAEDVRLAESRRCRGKGREWDRQAAIRCAIGATAQEAILDLGVDPRYRQPGDCLLQRCRGL